MSGPLSHYSVDSIEVELAAGLPYASYILEGLAAIYSDQQIRFVSGLAPASLLSGSAVAITVKMGRIERRIYVDLGDSTGLSKEAASWADVIGKVNLTPLQVEKDRVIPIGPAFGIRVRSRSLERRALWASYRTLRSRDMARQYAFLRGAAEYLHRRTRLERYQLQESDPNYIFYVAWPWKKHAEVNPPRAMFIQASRGLPGLKFEGGFAPRRRRDMDELDEFSAARRYPIHEYLAKTGRSVAAFNNPAVHGCLGWKLGEYLALGKAIITLPLDRALPSPLEPGVHVHEVDSDANSITEAIIRIRYDTVYRRSLEANARAWFARYLTPTAVVRGLLGE